MRRWFQTLPRLREGQRRLEERLKAIEFHQHQLAAFLIDQQRETRLAMAALGLPASEIWKDHPLPVPGGPAASAFPASTVCRQDSFSQPYFTYWTHRLGERLRYHRKLWEFVFICQALWERGAIRPEARGLGFGVGLEALPALFAAEGCRITATDMEPTAAAASGWADTGQHAWGLAALRRPALCPDALFDDRVTYRECDMNSVPVDLVDFDFCWSACALEHLGSIQQGLDFIERSVACLRPGGWAVHTTEFNLSSNDETVDHRDTVLFRRRDFEALAARLTAQGHQVAALDLTPGLQPLDVYVDLPPYREEPHLTMALLGYATTSVGLIVRRAGG